MLYFDKTIFTNPLFEYFKWLFNKIYYQLKNGGKHLRISYMAMVYNTEFGKYNWIGRNTIVSNSNIGDYTYITENSVVTETTLGKFCSIGPNVRIAPGKHPTSVYVSTHSSLYSNPSNLLKSFVKEQLYKYDRSVTIGNDVWVGANVVIIDGVTIGDGAIVAANSVITKDIEPYTIVGGLPGKPIGKRFEDDEIEFLLKFKWWDKPEDFIKKNISKWCSIKDFMSEFN
jgi:chloramphenicol O-acetyltransferase type B